MQFRANSKITDGNYDRSLAVKCINGTFVGRKEDGVIVYRGIPFVGKQPVGENRWKAPVDVVPDDGVYEAYYKGKSPCQHKDFSDVEDTLINQGEDCLYLNVWKADDDSTAKKPVMVWIHGGAFEFGAAAFSLFECDNFLRENPDVIIVTVAYRLGIFGYFHLSHLPDGGDFPDAQNLGPLDQLMGLKWVHENIAGFGGDPDNVTIYGESAGAGSVSLLPLLKGSHAYFKRVIAQSGSPTLTRSPEEAIDCTKVMMEVLGCKTAADLMKELDTCLVQLEEMIYRINATNMKTVKDGRTLTEMMAERDVLGKRLQVLREVFDRASQSQDRYGRNEIRYVTTIDVPALRKQIDTYSQQLRKLDMEIQTLNFSTDLEEKGVVRQTGSPGRRR